MPPCMRSPPASIAAIRSSGRSACSRQPSSRSDPPNPVEGLDATVVPARDGDAAVPSQSGNRMKNPRASGGSNDRAAQTLFLEPDAGKLLLEPREPPAAVHQLLLTASPGRM